MFDNEEDFFSELEKGMQTEVPNLGQKSRRSYTKIDYKSALENLTEGQLVVHMLRHGFYPSEICSALGVTPENLCVEDLVLLLERALFEVYNGAISPDKSIFRLLERLLEVRDLIAQNPDVKSASFLEVFGKILTVDMQTLEQRVKGACHGRC